MSISHTTDAHGDATARDPGQASLADERRRVADLSRMRARAYWTARGLSQEASAQPCGCDPAAGHLCDSHLADYEQFVFVGREPDWPWPA